MTETNTLSRKVAKEHVTRNLRRLAIHLVYTEMELQNFSEQVIPESAGRLIPLKRHARELLGPIAMVRRKINWYIGIVKATFGFTSDLRKELNIKDLDPEGHKACNVAQLTEWVMECNNDLSNEVDLVVNGSRRKELLRDSWRVALSTVVDRPWNDNDELRFTAWYNAHFSK